VWQVEIRGPSTNGTLNVFAGHSNPELADEICRYLDMPLGRTNVNRFSNENLMVHI
jgi:ribose-phosphate pyrophosphokinase